MKQKIALALSLSILQLNSMDWGYYPHWPDYAAKCIQMVKENKAKPSLLNECYKDLNLVRLSVHLDTNLPLAEELLEAGADPNALDSIDTPLEAAGSLKAVTLLLRYKADPKRCKNNPLHTVLMRYKYSKPQISSESEESDWRNETLATLQLLFAAGADINQENKYYDKKELDLSLLQDAYQEYLKTQP